MEFTSHGYTYENDQLIESSINGQEVDKYVQGNFNNFDKNGDGLTQAEFKKGLTDLGIENEIKDFMTDEIEYAHHHDDLYNKYIKPHDLNNDGKITQQELATITQQELAAQPKIDASILGGEIYQSVVNQGLEEFNKANTNGDLFLDKTEMAKMYPSMSQSEIDSSIKAGDINNDGKLSLGEFTSALHNGEDIDLKSLSAETAKQLAQYDLNNDGKITQDEIKEHDKEVDKGKGLSTGAIVGIVIGAVCVVGLIVGLIVCLSRNKKKDKEASAEKEQDAEKKEEKQENVGNQFDNKEKDVSYKVTTNLQSINQSKDIQR